MMLSTALSYAARGWRVFPQNGKLPMVAGGRGVHDATSDVDQIKTWWARYPRANIGLACGDTWWALDVDPGKGGTETMKALTAKHGRLPATVTSRTGGGGWHFLFRTCGVDFRNWVGGQCDAWPYLGVDIRARGVPITAPPSLHVSGNRYRWIDGRSPDDVEIAAPPAWLVKLATPPPLPVVVSARDAIECGWGPKPNYSRKAIDDACARIKSAPDGVQEATLNREAFGIGQLIAAGLMVEGQAKAWLVDAARQMESYNSRNPWTEKRIVEKINGGICAGKLRPNVRALAS